MKHLKIILCAALLMILYSCNRVNYIGQSFEKTETIDVFYDKDKINREYEIIGHAVSSGDRTNAIRSRMIKKAKQVGADAILITSLASGNNHVEASSVDVNASFLKFQ